MKDRSSMTFSRFAAAALAAALAITAGGCSWFGGTKSTEYKSGVKTVQPLEVPPELTAPTMDDRYALPDPRAQTSYSQYAQQGQQRGTPGQSGPAVLPKIEGARIERSGDQRWLVVKGAPEQVWRVVRQFWIDNGFELEREQPELGIMETGWHEDRERIPDDIIRRTIGRVFDKAWSTPYRDKYRTRLERGAEPNTTDVFISHRGFEEIYTNANQDDTKWVPTPPNREREAEMLSRLMVKIGAPDASARVAAAEKGSTPTRATQAPAPEAPKNAVLENAGAGPLVVNDGFDRAWRRVGLALDRVGFTVEDRDRSKGLLFVRYIDPDVDLSKQNVGKTSVWDKLAFWRSPPKSAQPQYRIHVTDAGATSQVVVQDSQGNPEKSSTGKKILTLLYDQLK
jgi:outer membrane protein assembly factor BamC